jgi:hypothetical protein
MIVRSFSRLFAIDPRSLAAFRIALGVIVLVDLWTRASAIEQHYSDLGILPRDAYERLLQVSPWQWSIHLLTGSVAGQSVLFVVAAAAACAMIAGYRTRAATAVSWFMLVSLQARNPMVLYGADQLLRLLLFWAMFLPLERSGARPTILRHVSMASAALLLQPCVMYFFAALLKWNSSWQSGSALGHALASDMYVTSFGRMLAGSPALVATFGRAVPWIELLAPLLLLMPWRTSSFRMIAFPVLVAFHLAMGAALHTGLFPLVTIAALIPFVPSEVWDRLGIGVAIAAPEVAPSNTWRAAALQALVALLFVYAVAWNVVGLKAEEYAAQQNFAWMKEWWSEGRKGIPLSFRDYAVERMMGPLGWLGRVTALQQRWDMFERVGPEYRGWPVAIGMLADGTKVNVLDATAPAEVQAHVAPEDPLPLYPGTRWLVYFTYLRTSGTQAARELLPAVMTRDWERRNPGKKLESLQILFVQPPPGKIELWYDGAAKGRDVRAT